MRNMAYFDFFCTNIGNSNGEEIKGTCNSMCPQEEIAMREKERNLLHVLEVLGPVRKLVKCYSRSAADSNMAVPHLLRPYPVLKDTVQYLLLEVTKRADVSETVRYDFVNDRLRAVRQDMTIQRLPAELCINLLEPMVRFYVYYGYRLCEHPLKDFDLVLNNKNLLECLKWFLTCCDAIQYQEEEKIDFTLSALVANMKISRIYKLKCDRMLMESLYLLCNMDDVHPLHRYWSLPKKFKSDCTLNMAYEVAIANYNGNFIRVCKLMDGMCTLTCSAVCLYLPTLQRRALEVISNAYSSKKLTVPCDKLRQWLRFNSDADAAAVCAHYGLKARGGHVLFSKTDFKSDAAILPPKKLIMLEEPDVSHRKMNKDIDYIFTYDTLR